MKFKESIPYEIDSYVDRLEKVKVKNKGNKKSFVTVFRRLRYRCIATSTGKIILIGSN